MAEDRGPSTTPVFAKKTVGRNDPCLCGSGKESRNVMDNMGKLSEALQNIRGCPAYIYCCG